MRGLRERWPMWWRVGLNILAALLLGFSEPVVQAPDPPEDEPEPGK